MILFAEQTHRDLISTVHSVQGHTPLYTHSLSLGALDCDVTTLHTNSHSSVRPVYSSEYSDVHMGPTGDLNPPTVTEIHETPDRSKSVCEKGIKNVTLAFFSL